MQLEMKINNFFSSEVKVILSYFSTFTLTCLLILVHEKHQPNVTTGFFHHISISRPTVYKHQHIFTLPFIIIIIFSIEFNIPDKSHLN